MSSVVSSDLSSFDPDKLSVLRLEVLDYIPLVSTVSGIARVMFGAIEATVGVVVFPIQLGGRVLNYRSSFVFNQGVANIIRGVIACTPIGGNIVLYFYDHSPVIKRDIRRAAGLDV